MQFSEEFVRIRNILYRSLSRCFNFTRDDMNMFIRAISRAFGRLRCNKVGAKLEEYVEEVFDDFTNSWPDEKNFSQTTLKKSDFNIVGNTASVGVPELIFENPARIEMHELKPRTGELLSNVAFVQIQPKKETRGKHKRRINSCSSENQTAKLSIWTKAKRTLTRTFLRGTSVSSTDVAIEDLEYDQFWATMSDANLVM